MLHPQNNSLEYSIGIAPPDGYELKYAIGTSYAIDLEALLLIPIAMIYASHIEKANGDLTYETISALSEVSKKIDIYCQKGHIKNPKQNNQLYSFWENSIHEVALDDARKSFHPKVWIMQFANKKQQIKYKLFVTSRNLTQSGDWDIAYATDGEVGEEKNNLNKPLIDFVSYLASFNSNTIPIDFIEKLAFVNFEIPAGWKSQTFLPIGIPNYENILQKKKFDELLVISPFLDKTTINKLQNNSTKLTICSTRDALDTIIANKLPSKHYQFNTTIEGLTENEDMFDEIDEKLLSQSLHAKLFIGKKADTISWNMGSANATSPAFEARNVEFNIELMCKDDNYSPNNIVKQLAIKSAKDGNDIKLFEEYKQGNLTKNAETQKINEQLRQLMFAISFINIKGELMKADNNIEYNIKLLVDTSEISFSTFKVKIKPLSCYRTNAIGIPDNTEATELLFENVPLKDVSQFLIWEIYYNGDIIKEFLTKLNIVIPYDERQSKIFKEIFDSKEKLFKYISFLISNDENETINQQTVFNKLSRVENEIGSLNNIAGLPIYEKLLIASSRMPHKLEAISKLIKTLTTQADDDSKSLISQEFSAFWAEFENYKNISNGKIS
jgi:hypothetical protein